MKLKCLICKSKQQFETILSQIIQFYITIDQLWIQLQVMMENKALSSLNKPASFNVILQKSVFETRPMTIFFQYPEYWGVSRQQKMLLFVAMMSLKKMDIAYPLELAVQHMYTIQ